ncbi:MAG: hypothetical protein ACOCV1_03720 [Bacillota bacterium]
MSNLNPFETHKPILQKIITDFNIKSILEFGMGNYSTKMFLEYCNEVVSIEMQDSNWYDVISEKYKDDKKLTALLKLGEETFLEYVNNLNRKFDLVFVDGHGHSRWEQINSCFDKTSIISAHDTESKIYKWYNVNLPDSWYWIDIKNENPWTSIISNDLKLKETIMSSFQCTEVKDLNNKEYVNYDME